MSLQDENFDLYMCMLAHNIWKFPFWMEERAKENENNEEVKE